VTKETEETAPVLTWRDWRWMWLYQVAKWPVWLLFVPPYLAVEALHFLLCKIDDGMHAFYVRAHNADLGRRSGYARAPGAPRPEGWLSR
jgi:hypothetical protein